MNWGIIIAAIASFIFGWLFYSKALFGNLWIKFSGVSKEQIRKSHTQNMGGKLLVNLLASIVTAWVLLFLIGKLTINSSAGAISLVFKLWLGFIVSTTLIGNVLWENKSLGLFFLNAFYWLLNLAIMALVLIAFIY